MLIVNGLAVVVTVVGETPRASDWGIMERAARLAGTAELYDPAGMATYVWSPVAAFALQAIQPLGVWLWRAILVAAALALPSWRLRLIVLISWPFWADWAHGNLVTLIFLAAVYAWRGSRGGTAAFFLFAMLIPRPLLAPMALWIVWNRPEWRVPFGAMFAVHGFLVLWTGLGSDWVMTLLHVGPELVDSLYNRSPTREIGYWWMLVGIPLGASLFWRGRVGWAGLAISPYVWSYYLFWALPELNRPRYVGIVSRRLQLAPVAFRVGGAKALTIRSRLKTSTPYQKGGNLVPMDIAPAGFRAAPKTRPVSGGRRIGSAPYESTSDSQPGSECVIET
jgi:hypothetical protein